MYFQYDSFLLSHIASGGVQMRNVVYIWDRCVSSISVLYGSKIIFSLYIAYRCDVILYCQCVCEFVCVLIRRQRITNAIHFKIHFVVDSLHKCYRQPI